MSYHAEKNHPTVGENSDTTPYSEGLVEACHQLCLLCGINLLLSCSTPSAAGITKELQGDKIL
ncbi:hypothetical protein V7S43_010261 [Phytophthora oleae]|uniref:Uncharacterized protein n=1 Tax=Phytophthora oleae TaxID=2107226 RepID=A0ABD3FG52_9STRA